MVKTRCIWSFKNSNDLLIGDTIHYSLFTITYSLFTIIFYLTFGFSIITMPVCKNYLILLLALAVMTGCKHKKKLSLSGDEPVEVGDFIEFFQPLRLPYQFSDTVFRNKEKDSLLISNKVFTQFVPDSVLNKVFGKGVKPRIYPAGRVEVPKAETYLFVKAIAAEKKAVLLLVFDKKKQFIAHMAVLRPDQQPTTQQSVVMDRKYTITKTVQRKNPDGSLSEGRDVFVLDPDTKNFMLIMTDALDDKLTELVNPIDTLSRKNKFSADYVTDKLNLVSIRDGRRNDRVTFFVHFEKNNGECTGELKGEAILHSGSMAEYRLAGDPCVLQFNFTSSSVTLKEEGCGSHRELGCVFDGSYPRKKVVKPKNSKGKPAGKK
jgi:hypothetical protein